MEEYITDIKQGKSKKSIIYINDLPAFSLYDSEIRKLKLKVDEIVNSSLIEEIENNILKPRALNRCLALLKTKEYTKKELMDKLTQGYYPENVIVQVIKELEDNRFLNDSRYAEEYIAFHSLSKSRTMVEHALYLKGIDKETIELAYESFFEYAKDPERDLCIKSLENKYPRARFNLDNESGLSEEETYQLKNKAKAFLARKGFSYSLINELVEEYF